MMQNSSVFCTLLCASLCVAASAADVTIDKSGPKWLFGGFGFQNVNFTLVGHDSRPRLLSEDADLKEIHD